MKDIKNAQQEWFGAWFNSKFYHILYKNRDEKEAELFMSNLCNHLSIQKNEQILDLACGKGRHSLFLNKMGFTVTGVDLAPDSIKEANKEANDTLKFAVHDMRQPFQVNGFDYVFNLFTSFGYFEDEKENLLTLRSIHKNLKTNGILVIDFLNPTQVIKNLVPSEEKTIDDITFRLERKVIDNWIIKNIFFSSNKKDYHFQERVKALYYDNFLNLFEESNFEVLEVFGSFELDAFDIENSKRMIFIVKKKA